MKKLLLCLLISLVGCTTRSPKEDLRNVFLSVRERKYQDAETKLTNSAKKSMIGMFDTYNGQAISSVDNSGNYIFTRIQGSIEYCDKHLAEIRQVNTSSSDEEHNWDNFKVNEANEKFKQYCSSKDDAILEAQDISSVDFQSMFKDLNLQFEKEIKRIRGKFSMDQAKAEKDSSDAAIAKERYEQSEEYYSKKLCEMRAIINAANAMIDKEKEAANVSGYVDKKKMYDAGQAIVANKKRIENFRTEYKKKFGKDWHESSCK